MQQCVSVVAVPFSAHSQLQQLRVEVSGAVDGAQRLKEEVEVSGWIKMAACEGHSSRV